MKLFAALSLLLTLSSCATATKQTRAERADDLFEQLDTNHDGYLSRAELAAGLQYAGGPEMNPNLVMGLESNTAKKKIKASRRLTKAEVDRSMREAFGSRDANLDGRLSKDEFKKLVVERPRGENDDPWEPFM